MNVRVLLGQLLRAGARIVLVRRKVVYAANIEEIRDIAAKIPVQFRFGTQDDLDRLSADVHDYDSDARRYSTERLQLGDKLILGESHGNVVFYGWAMFGQLDMSVRRYINVVKDTVASYRLFTVPEQRGNKLCAAYFSFLAQALRKAGYRRIVSWVEARNRSSCRVHEQAGFRPIGSIWSLRFLFRLYFFISTKTRRSLQQDDRNQAVVMSGGHPAGPGRI